MGVGNNMHDDDEEGKNRNVYKDGVIVGNAIHPHIMCTTTPSSLGDMYAVPNSLPSVFTV